MIADGFLSMQPFPEMDTTFMSGNSVSWMVMEPNIDSRSRLRSLGDAGTLGVQWARVEACGWRQCAEGGGGSLG